MNKSIWESYLKEKQFNPLNENIDVDVLVIGGGVAGILTLKKLQDNNINAVLVEKNTIGSGTTSKTTAFLTIQHETLYQDLKKTKRKAYLNLNTNALNEYFELAKKYNFDLEKCDSCLFAIDKLKIKKEYEILKELNQDVYLIDDIPFTKENLGISFKDQAIINPIKLINTISSNLNIFEKTEVVKLYKNYAVLRNNKIIRFKKVVIATNYPIKNKSNFLFMKLTKQKSYVVVIKKEKIKGTFCSINQNGMYFRTYQDYLIIGGNDTVPGKMCFSQFKDKIKKLFNIIDDDIVYSYSGIDCKTLDNIPYIGNQSIFSKNHFIITGFNLWGFTWSMAASNIILDMIKNKKKCALTNPNRIILSKELFKNIYISLKNLITFRKPKCTHLGCALIYNKEEEIYECPCHGSIYNKDGKVIIGPAHKNIKKS